MCCRLTRFLLKIGAIEPLCCPLHIRTTNNNKGESTVPKFLKGFVSENVLLSEPLRLADLKTAPDFPREKTVLSNRRGIHCKYGQQAGAVR